MAAQPIEGIELTMGDYGRVDRERFTEYRVDLLAIIQPAAAQLGPIVFLHPGGVYRYFVYVTTTS